MTRPLLRPPLASLLLAASGALGVSTGHAAPAVTPSATTAPVATAPVATGTPPVDGAHAALVKNVTGTVRVVRAGGSLELTPGMALRATDRLVSEAGSSAGLAFRDGTLLTIGPSATVELRQYVYDPDRAKYAFSIYLARGSAVYESGKIGKVEPAAVRVDTPNATVGVRGTRFLVTAED